MTAEASTTVAPGRNRRDQHGTVDGGRYTAELGLAVELAIAAGRLQVERAGRLERIDRKGRRDVVTEVDVLSEELILAGIRERFPADAVLAEESAARGPANATRAADRRWVVDPLDGTINYANGIPFYAVSIALVDSGASVVGVVHDPVRNETFTATADGPALLDGQPIQPGSKESIGDLVVTLAIGGRRLARGRTRLFKAVRASRSLGCAALTLAYVANGRFDAYAQAGGLSAWDVAAAGLVAERAGAIVTDIGGGAWFDLSRRQGRWGVLAAAPGSHAELLALLHATPGAEPLPETPPGSDAPHAR